MYNFHFVVNPKEKIDFINHKAQLQLKNISHKSLAFKIRTTNNKDFNVIGNKGILAPQSVTVIQIICNQQSVPKAKFQILTTIIHSDENIESAFQRSNSEQIMIQTLKTASSQISEENVSMVSASAVAATIIDSPRESVVIQTQISILHLLIVGISCLFIGYMTHMLQNYQK